MEDLLPCVNINCIKGMKIKEWAHYYSTLGVNVLQWIYTWVLTHKKTTTAVLLPNLNRPLMSITCAIYNWQPPKKQLLPGRKSTVLRLHRFQGNTFLWRTLANVDNWIEEIFSHLRSAFQAFCFQLIIGFLLVWGHAAEDFAHANQ